MRENYEYLLLQRSGAAVTVTLNRPDKLNSVNEVMHEELMDLFLHIDSDDESRVLVLTGAGRAFCAGGDVGQMPGARADGVAPPQPLYLHSRPLIEALLRVQKPVIAMVNGLASGLGTTLALFCDIVISSDSAHFTDSHVSIGLVAGDGGSVIYPLLVGVSRAKELLMLGQRVYAADAERLGLVNHVIAHDELGAYTADLAAKLAEQPPFAVRATKASVNRQLLRTYQDVMDASGAWQLISLKSDEHKQAVQAFADRRAKTKS